MPPTGRPLPGAEVVLAHDYVTQRGGAERVALRLAEAFPGAPMHTTLYEPDRTFPEFAALDVRPGPLNRYALLRRHHRLALPVLARAVEAQRLTGRLLIASSTGWAHGYRGTEHSIVYCHAPARWLYQSDRYLGNHPCHGIRGAARKALARAALSGLAAPLRRWDQRCAHRADLYLVNSTVTQLAVAELYGIDAEVLPPPPALLPEGEEHAVDGVEPGYLLCVARLLPYKNVDAVIEAVNALPGTRLVVVGAGPDAERLQALAGPTVRLLGVVPDAELRWLYRNAAALVAASYEDYGLSPLEAGAFGRPSVVLRQGGFLDTVAEHETGVFFDHPTPVAIAAGVREALARSWEERPIRTHVNGFSRERFVSRLQALAGQFLSSPATVPGDRPGARGAPSLVA